MTRINRASWSACTVAVVVALSVWRPLPVRAQCAGDLDGNRTVTVSELITCVNVALDLQAYNPGCDSDTNGAVDITDLMTEVSFSLAGCPGQGTPSPTPTPYVPTPCIEVTASNPLPAKVDKCYKIVSKGMYLPQGDGNVNIVKGGALYFVEDSTGTIDLRVKSLLVEYGGTLQAGSPDRPFGKDGGKLSIGLYGDDPSMEATVPNPPPGIQCQTNVGGQNPCFPSEIDLSKNSYYCTQAGSDSPCSSTGAPGANPNNKLLESYGNLNFDPTSFGYKVLGVSYGGTLNLFGYKGAKPLQGPDGAAIANGEDTSCPVPDANHSKLDSAEMQAWADLSGSSWARLSGINTDRTQLTLDRVVWTKTVQDWAPGDQIVIGTTDWYPSHSEIRTIRSVGADGKTITVCRPIPGGTGPGGCAATVSANDALDYPHFASIFDAAKLEGAEYTEALNRTAADLRATVGLLSRSIQIRSLGASATDEFPDVNGCLFKDDTAPDHSCYFGGHVMIRQGFKAAQLQGVEFKQLGQGGRIGHYPVHFHLVKNTEYTNHQAFLKDSSVWDSMTRFVVLHGSHGITVARNVGFLSMGHGYYLEDGSEIDNRLCSNLGVSVRGSLKEFFTAQADAKNWNGTPPAPALAARYIPPILDGVCPGPHAEDCNCLNPKDRPNPPSSCTVADDVRLPAERTGSDSFMPVTFWAMNAANEFVGNAAVGVHGFGSCYWLLGSGVSGPSFHHHKFDGPDTPNNTGGTVLANYNSVAKGYQAPLRRFRGNSCSTAALALPAQAEIPPAPIPFKGDPYSYNGFTAAQNPYLLENGKPKPASKLEDLYDRPAVQGNFQPIQPNNAGPGMAFFTNCAQTAANGPDAEKNGLLPNTKSCVTTVIDRFSTSYNWTEVNFGSIWLRPWFYMFLNSAITDQLFGGLTIVTAGSWIQVPPAYFSLAKDSLFVGTTQFGSAASQYARRSGPIFAVTADDTLNNGYGPCKRGNGVTCNLDFEGVGIWSGAFNPKRLVNIYDGPHFADGNLFLNVGAWECDPQPCQGKGGKGECPLPNGFPCGIYGSTMQPAVNTNGNVDPHKMIVLDAPVGWKQPNGFYYPPAFAYRAATFLKKIPQNLQDLNMCYSFGPDDGFKEPKLRPGSCRHNVIDRTRDYIVGNMGINPAGAAAISGPSNPSNPLPIGPIDFQTILIDLDASLTGASGTVDVSSNQCAACGADCMTPDGHKGKCAGSPGCTTCEVTLPTTSLSRNAFFNAPSQGDECLSFGLQTSPYQFVTSVMAELEGSPATTNPTYVNKVDPQNWPDRPGVAIYRQWKLNGEEDAAGQVCDAGISGAERGTFMVGPNIYHSPTLTQSEPPDLNGQPGAIYYVDTSGGTTTKSFTGSATFKTPNTISGTGIGTGLFSGYSIVVQGATTPENNVAFTVQTVSPNSITVTPNVFKDEGPTANVSVSHQLQSTCFPSAIGFKQATFLKNKSYVLYHLFARNDAAVSYQMFVGDGTQSVDAIQGRFVRVNPRLVGSTGTEASLVTKSCKPGDQNDWCKDLPVPQVKDGLLTFKLDQRKIAADFVTDSRADYERCMPRDMCYYNSTTKKCESCASATGSKDQCIRQSDLAPDYATLNLPDASGRKALDVVCEDWSQLASGTTDKVVGELTMADCPKDGCLGFAFTLPDNFVGNKTYNDVGAKNTQCFQQAAWKNAALVARKDGANLADPLCGEPRAAMSSDFCGMVGPTETQTPTPTITPTGMASVTATKTSTPGVTATPTQGLTPTRTPTGATSTPTRSTSATPTPTRTTARTPTPTPKSSTTPTNTPTPGGGLTWILKGTPVMSVTIPQTGMSYAEGELILQDSQSRFCTGSGLHPIVLVDYGSGSTANVGTFPTVTTSQLSIGNIPGPRKPGTFDLVVQTRPGCKGGVSPIPIRFPGAISYLGTEETSLQSNGAGVLWCAADPQGSVAQGGWD